MPDQLLIFAVIASLVIIAIWAAARFFEFITKKREEQEQAPRPYIPASAYSPPANPPPAKLVLEEPSPPADPNDIQISGPIPIIGKEDVHQSKTQPIPKVTLEGEKIVVSDHVLFSFYQKLTDPKAYDIAKLCRTRRQGYQPYNVDNLDYAISVASFEPHVAYDTTRISIGVSELSYFRIPSGQAGKTQVDTNTYVGGVLVFQPFQFFWKAIVLRFMGEVKKLDRQLVLERGLFRLVDGMTSRMRLDLPLSMFAPLNPFDTDPKAFFHLSGEFMLCGHDYIDAGIYFPNGVAPSEEITLRVEIPGIRTQSAVLAPFV